MPLMIFIMLILDNILILVKLGVHQLRIVLILGLINNNLIAIHSG